ncbi:MAG: pilus assembly protein CpaE [Actinomycetota bacterium]
MVAGSAQGPLGRGPSEDRTLQGLASEGWIEDRALGEARSGPERPHVSPPLARRLREAGLAWTPANGDRFVIPDRGLDEHVFLVSPMSVEVRESPGGLLLTFNGAVEWALDAIVVGEAVWLPSEGQVRERLGEAFAGLEPAEGGYRCHVDAGAPRASFHAAEPADAYALALLHLLDGARPR